MRAHALLSASGAAKWLICPPSARLEEQFPDTTSTSAEEGTLAHAIAELKMRRKFTEPMGTRAFNKQLAALKEHPLYAHEMLEHTDGYVDYVTRIAMRYKSAPLVAVERRLDYSHIAPEGFGTGDCILISGGDLHVIDFKYGQGVPVAAENNPQLLLYALGALAHYGRFYGIASCHLHIFQPRIENNSEWGIPVPDLLRWGEEAKPKAALAFAGEGEYSSGAWCKSNFCLARPGCRACAGAATALEDFGFREPPLLSDAEVGEVLTRAKLLTSWVSDLEEYALAAALQGRDIPGWKAVEGRSTRQFTDTDLAFEKITDAGFDASLLYERKPITLTDVEKLLGKVEFAELLEPFVHKPQGKPTLAPADDPREPYSKTTAKEDFCNVPE